MCHKDHMSRHVNGKKHVTLMAIKAKNIEDGS